MKRLLLSSLIGIVTFVLGVVLFIHFTFGLNIIFDCTHKLSLSHAPEDRCMDSDNNPRNRAARRR